jgi:hypothetical protein
VRPGERPVHLQVVDDLPGVRLGEPPLVLALVFGERREDDELVEAVVEDAPALVIPEELRRAARQPLIDTVASSGESSRR